MHAFLSFLKWFFSTKLYNDYRRENQLTQRSMSNYAVDLTPSNPPLTIARIVRPYNNELSNKVREYNNLELGLCSEGGGGITLHCPHCKRQYGVVAGFFADIGSHALVECPCGKYHMGCVPFGGCH